MTRNRLSLVLLLAIASAAIGAGTALLVDSTTEQPTRPTVERIAAASADDKPGAQESRVASAPEPAESRGPPQADSSGDEQAQQQPSQIVDASEPPADASESRIEDAGELAVEGEEAQPEPLVRLSPEVIRQGESFSLTVEHADAFSVVATVGNRTWNLQRVDETAWWGIVAVPRDAPNGVALLVVDLYSEGGVWLDSLSATVLVLASPAPLEEIILGGSGVAASPEEVQRDHDVRFVEHVAVSGPPRWLGRWILPVEGEVTGVFGARRSYDGVMSDQWHHGHDIAAHHGDPIVAPAPGRVVWTGDLAIHGIGVMLDHGAGVYSGYWHMSLIAVHPGDEVDSGDWLGNIGTTGLSTGPHLHWEVIVQGVDVDPVQWTRDDGPALPMLLPDSADTAETADTLG
ncbi:MAG: peptidoglycan DD-metalloendopeptidase family protein [Chloroflexi bacterium]|nr:peptidoglycan DD-metalloendopeptidase family protein [Chloroflexota bacterium]MYF21947.1 peptidoglycan DD-metalloendopeptidase family protein [Chloroflexota bacterium]